MKCVFCRTGDGQQTLDCKCNIILYNLVPKVFKIKQTLSGIGLKSMEWRLWLNIDGLVQTIEQCSNFYIIVIYRRSSQFIVFFSRYSIFGMIFKNNCFQVPWITKDGRIFFERETVFGLSKLNQLSEWVDQLNEAAASSFKGDQQAILQVIFCWNGVANSCEFFI